MSVISVVYNSFICKESPFFFFLILISDFFYKYQVILIMIKISELNQADLNRPNLDNKYRYQVNQITFDVPVSENCCWK